MQPHDACFDVSAELLKSFANTHIVRKRDIVRDLLQTSNTSVMLKFCDVCKYLNIDPMHKQALPFPQVPLPRVADWAGPGREAAAALLRGHGAADRGALTTQCTLHHLHISQSLNQWKKGPDKSRSNDIEVAAS